MARDLEKEFSSHKPPTEEVINRHEAMRTSCLHLAEFLSHIVPESNEQNKMLDKLNEVMFWGNAAIARYPDKT